MTFEELKTTVLAMSDADQRRLITEVVPAIWPRACLDESCVTRVRELVDEDTVREYKKEHMDSI